MEDSMDMGMSLWRLFSCELKAYKDYHFKVDNDENEHQLSLRIVRLRAGTKDELHIIEAEAMNYEGSPIKVALATLKMTVQPMVSIGGFELIPPVVLRGKCGSRPVNISGQHLVVVEEDAESEDEEEEDVKLLSMSGKGGNKVPQKKVKLSADEDEDEDEDDEDNDDDDFDDNEAEEKAPVKKPPKNRKKKTPKTPKGPSSVEDIKGGSLPKVENCFQMTDQEAIQDLWQWRKFL
uniref:Nucleophosmin n=1 Tax=Jaculus jaculus TaxID=51337 RepID=A0A8C5LKQ2_JACJA